jgi:hypothetical protein
VAAVLLLYVLIRFVPIPGVPCELSAVEDCPSGDEAIALVPADAYAYAQLELDPDSSQVEQARELIELFPGFPVIAQGTLQAGGLDPDLSLGEDIEPWLGDEVAAAIVPGEDGAPLPLALLATGDPAEAERFIELAGGDPTSAEYRGVELTIYSPRLASAFRDGFLLAGDPGAVRAAIDAEGGSDSSGSLEDDEAVADVSGALPEARLAYAYVSEEGISRLLEGRGGLAAQLDTFTDYDASTGIGAGAIAAEDGLELELHSELDPEQVAATPGFFSAFPSFDPGLAEELAPGTLAMLAIGDPSRTVRDLLDQADAALPGIAGAFDRFNAALVRQGAVDIEDGLVPLLGGEAVAALAPGRRVPNVTVVFDEVDEARVTEAVARLQVPLIAALDPSRTGVAPTFSEVRIGDVTAHSLRVTPAIDLTYAVSDGRLVISTHPKGVRQALTGERSLADTESYRTATAGSSEGVAALVFLNLEGLVQLAEPIGLAEITAGFRSDLDRLKALGLTVRSGEASLETKIFLEIR